MRTKYHINPETGVVEKCIANKSCLFSKNDKNMVHYDTEKAAQEAYENMMANNLLRVHHNKGLPSLSSSIKEITEKIIESKHLSPDEVWSYARHHKIVSSDSGQNSIVLRKMLDNTNGICRQCLVDQIREEEGITLGQGGTRVIATLRDRGFNIPKNKKEYCPIHKGKKPFDQLQQPYITGLSFERVNWSKSERERILKAFPAQEDAISGAKNSTNDPLEIDHRIPVQRRIVDGISKIDMAITDTITDKEIVEEYQLLTRKNNLIKDRACSSCITSGTKPKTIDGVVRIEGSGAGQTYEAGINDCSSCVFAYPEKFGLPISVSIKS